MLYLSYQGCSGVGKSRDHAPPSFLWQLLLTPRCKMYHMIPQWSRLWSGSQMSDCNCCFCYDHSCICFLYQGVVFHRNSLWTVMFLTWIIRGNSFRSTAITGATYYGWQWARGTVTKNRDRTSQNQIKSSRDQNINFFGNNTTKGVHLHSNQFVI